MTVQIGLLIALLCAAITNVSMLAKHRGANDAPDIDMRHPWRSAKALFTSRWWTIGFALAAVAWLLHIGALAMAPLSLVQAVIAGGLVLLALPAEKWFGFNLGRREWTGLSLGAVGLALLGLTAHEASGAHHSYHVATMAAFELGMISVGVLLLLSGRSGRAKANFGAALGAASGLLVGVSDVSLKALTGTVPADPMSIFGPWTLIAACCGLAAFFCLAKGFQIGSGIQVIALSSISANVAAVLGGVIVFGDPIGDDFVGISLRAIAFISVIAAAALIPGPVRAAEAQARAA